MLKDPFVYLIGVAGILKDKNPAENKCDGMNSTNWSHGYICENCMSFVGHEEQMTGICLSCGDCFDFREGRVSTRMIIHNNKWARQIKWRGKNYINNKQIKIDGDGLK